MLGRSKKRTTVFYGGDMEPTSRWREVAGIVLALTVLISAVLTAFAWPAARSSVHDVPIAVAGPTPVADRVEQTLDQRQPGAFTITRVPDTAAAEAAVEAREVYGAIDVSGGSPTVLVATAGSPVVAQLLQSVAAASAGAPAAPVRDLAPLPAADPRGGGLAAASLPLVLGGILAAVLITNRLRGASRRLTAALAYSVTGGLAMAAILQFWLGSLEGSYWANAGAIALAVGATAMTIIGLEALLGTVGFGIGAVIMMLVGNPFSGAQSAPEMLPGWSGELGRYLPPGAAGWLLRSTAFFGGEGIARPLAVLFAWLAVGILLVVVGSSRSRGRTAAESREPALVS
jgi:hypothetical protein